MPPTRTLPTMVGLALALTLAACGTVGAVPAPSNSDAPTPSPSPEPSPTPTVSPTPAPTGTPIAPVTFDLPRVAVATSDDVSVHTLPRINAPLVTGERTIDLSPVPNVHLQSGDRVFVTLGPVVADGHSWYEVALLATDVRWKFGWVSADYLKPIDELISYNQYPITFHGLGRGAAADTDVTFGSAVTVRFAAVPMPDADSCHIEVTLVRSDGTPVNVATETVTSAIATQLTSTDLPSLYQEEDGIITLDVETDCSFAALVAIPQG